jgi:hypothetical protein
MAWQPVTSSSSLLLLYKKPGLALVPQGVVKSVENRVRAEQSLCNEETMMSKSALGTIEDTLNQLTVREKLKLIERLARSLRAQPPPRSLDPRRAALNQLRKELAALPVANPRDGFSGRDHDQLLYGDRH